MAKYTCRDGCLNCTYEMSLSVNNVNLGYFKYNIFLITLQFSYLFLIYIFISSLIASGTMLPVLGYQAEDKVFIL